MDEKRSIKIDVTVGVSLEDFKVLQEATYCFNEYLKRRGRLTNGNKPYTEDDCLRFAICDFYNNYYNKLLNS